MRACPSEASAGVLMSTPMRSVRSPARAVSGHATAELPTNEMKSRRLMCPQIEGPNLPYRRGTETALCNTAKLGGRGRFGSKPECLPNTRMSASTSCGHPSHRLWPALCHNRTHAVQQKAPLFDHFVSAREQHRWHIEAEQPRRLQVDDELEFGRLLDRKIGGLLAL